MFKNITYGLKSLLKRPFKVAIVTYYYPGNGRSYNGVAIHTYYLSRELAKLGTEVHIFTKGEKTYTKEEYIEEGKIVIHSIDVNIKNQIKDNVVKKRMAYFYFDNKIINEVTKEHSNEDFDIIHTHGWLTAGAFIAKQLNNIDWIHTFHALEKNRLKFMSKDEKKYSQIAKWVESTISHADSLIAVSETLRNEVIENYAVKPKKTFYIPNGIDLDIFKPGENVQNKKVLYVGRFSLEKGIDLIPKIARKVFAKDKEVKFQVIAADINIPPSLKKIKEEMQTLEKAFPGRFIWTKEPITQKEIAKMYNEATIIIQPSRYEAFGLAVLEAMACGKAVISSNKGALPEVVDNAGLSLPLNSELFAKNLVILLNDFKLRERYSRRAIKRAETFNWKRIGKETLDLYKMVSGKKEEAPEESLKNLGEIIGDPSKVDPPQINNAIK